jgi:hypothetical protein
MPESAAATTDDGLIEQALIEARAAGGREN